MMSDLLGILFIGSIIILVLFFFVFPALDFLFEVFWEVLSNFFKNIIWNLLKDKFKGKGK